MDTQATRRRRERKRTWTAFGPIDRRPNDYEIVTHGMNHTMGSTPLEMGPQVHGNVWLRRYRDAIALKVSSWDGFRDPARLTYDAYVKAQDDAESYVDRLLEAYTGERSIDETLDNDCLVLLGDALTPQRYLVHAQQMLAAYVQQLAPSSYIANCAAFQTADHLRRVQRVAYRTRQLDGVHPALDFGSRERAVWEKDPRWQPTRRAIERLLGVFAWDEVFVGYNLVVRPILDELFLGQLSRALRAAGDELDALLLGNLEQDGKRHDGWAVALARYMVTDDAANRREMVRIAAPWWDAGEAIIEAGAALVTTRVKGLTAEAVAADVRRRVAPLRAEVGLGADA